MKIKTVVVGSYQTNCYILNHEGKVLIIDPGDEFSKIKKSIGNNEVVGILLTHRHFDHVSALEECIREYHVPVFEKKNLEEKEYVLGPFHFHAYFTPGHTKDSVIYVFKYDEMIFTGDFIFNQSIGRTDLGGNEEDMQQSIIKICKMIQMDNIRKEYFIYPGHGRKTEVMYELMYNPYLQISENPILFD